jgi:hypothetical protein
MLLYSLRLGKPLHKESVVILARIDSRAKQSQMTSRKTKLFLLETEISEKKSKTIKLWQIYHNK